MEQQSPLCVLERLGGAGQDESARFPSVLLDMARTEAVFSRDPEDGSDLLAIGMLGFERSSSLQAPQTKREHAKGIERVRAPLGLSVNLDVQVTRSRTRTMYHCSAPTSCYNRRVLEDDVAWMRVALAEAERALEHGDVPVGAVAVRDGVIVGRGHNRREADADPTAHAEILALQEAARALGRWRLLDVTLYCTLEPCPMCAGAMLLARLPRLVYAADDPKMGAVGSVVELLREPRFNHQVSVTRGVLAEEAQALLARFFTELRSATRAS